MVARPTDRRRFRSGFAVAANFPRSRSSGDSLGWRLPRVPLPGDGPATRLPPALSAKPGRRQGRVGHRPADRAPGSAPQPEDHVGRPGRDVRRRPPPGDLHRQPGTHVRPAGARARAPARAVAPDVPGRTGNAAATIPARRAWSWPCPTDPRSSARRKDRLRCGTTGRWGVRSHTSQVTTVPAWMTVRCSVDAYSSSGSVTGSPQTTSRSPTHPGLHPAQVRPPSRSAITDAADRSVGSTPSTQIAAVGRAAARPRAVAGHVRPDATSRVCSCGEVAPPFPEHGTADPFGELDRPPARVSS